MRRKTREITTDGYIVRDRRNMPTAAAELDAHIAIELRNRHCGYPDAPARLATAEEQRAIADRRHKPRRKRAV